MPHYNPHEDVFSSSHFLSPSGSSPRKAPSRQSISARRSTASLRAPTSLVNGNDEDPPNGRHHSLAHELAVALMPEPTAGSKLLAEEFGIEFDEGAEGIDEQPIHHNGHFEEDTHSESVIADINESSFSDELVAQLQEASFGDDSPDTPHDNLELDPIFDSPTVQRTRPRQKTPEKDAMDVLSQNLESTDKFLTHLRTLDTEPGSSSLQPRLERHTSDIIRHMNDSIKDREGQLRELLESEREFRKIGGEVGGIDVLGQLDALDELEASSELPSLHQPLRLEPRQLDTLEEEPTSPAPHQLSHNHHLHNHHDWELDPDRNHLGDADYESEPATSPIKDSFPQPPPINGPATPAKTIPQLTHLRSFTTSLISSLTVISEHTQVNGVATAEAGRKIRSLKNKLGGLRTDWDSAERSKARINRFEYGIVDNSELDGNATSSPRRLPGGRRVDGRAIVQEHLQAFELALTEATLKTQAIMAR